MAAARIHAELSVQDLWLRYLALGGTGDAFELDGYLQDLMPLDTFQEDILAHALNEGLQERYKAYAVPLSAATAIPDWNDDRLTALVDELLGQGPTTPRPDPRRPGEKQP